MFGDVKMTYRYVRMSLFACSVHVGMNDMSLFTCGGHVGINIDGINDMMLFVILRSLVWWIPPEVVLVDTQLGASVLRTLKVFFHLFRLDAYDVVSLPILDHV